MNADIPILEFDGGVEAVIEPSRVVQPIDIPERCVLPLYLNVVARLAAGGRLTHLTDLQSVVLGALPVYRMEHEGASIAVAIPGVGSPLVAAFMEELIALGCRKFVACGGAGVLDRSLVRGIVVVPTAAVRDEGTSFHYVAPSREIAVAPDVVDTIEAVLRRHRVDYRAGKTWTTDAIYRETRPRVARRKAEGCLTVEMECAAFLAVAQHRGVRFGQILSTGDDVSGVEWDPRGQGAPEHISHEERAFRLAVEACLEL